MLGGNGGNWAASENGRPRWVPFRRHEWYNLH